MISEPPTDAELDTLIDLISQFGRTKLSTQSLLLRPKWREEVIAQIKDAGMEFDDPEPYMQWLLTFYRLSRRLNHDQRGLNMKAVADTIGVPLSTATRLTDNFVTRGLLERQPDSNDRRIVLVSLTSKGHRAFQIVDNSIRQRLEALLLEFNSEEREQLFSLALRLFNFWMASLEDVAPHPSKEAHTP